MLRIIGSVTNQMMSWMTVQSPITDCAQEMVKKMVGRCDLGPVSEADGSPAGLARQTERVVRYDHADDW